MPCRTHSDRSEPRDYGPAGHRDVVDSTAWIPRAWVREQGIVLQSARGPLPNLAEWIAGEPIRGSWWGHPSRS